MTPRPLIYTPRGRALEYGKLAGNLYSGCPHKCRYCYVPDTLHRDREGFADVKPVTDALERLKYDLFTRRKGQPLPYKLFMSFTCDPYCEQEGKYRLTRSALEMLHTCGSYARILTKNASASMQDICNHYIVPGDEFGMTLTCANDIESVLWEPCASTPSARLDALEAAHDEGVTTWVSFEPVLYPDQVFNLIDMTRSYVDYYKIGMLNHANELHERFRCEVQVDWSNFAAVAMQILMELGKTFYIKEDLRKYLPDYLLQYLTDGWWKGARVDLSD